MASETETSAGSPLARPCLKCRAQEATLDSRSQPVCRDCFAKFISTKCIKQIGILGKETKAPNGGGGGQGPPASSQRKYLLGLSLGVSSSVLVHLLNENVEFQLAKGRAAPFELTVVHVDASSSSTPSTGNEQQTEALLDRYRQRYPRFDFQRVPLSAALGVKTIDWSTLPSTSSSSNGDDNTPEQKLSDLLARLPSTTSRADMTRLFTRHLLIASARTHGCNTVLLGHSTTALAELTLAETAKGRGFSLPWQVNDGVLPIVDYTTTTTTSTPAQEDETTSSSSSSSSTSSILIYHPLRDILRKELVTYTTLPSPPLTELIPPPSSLTSASIVSHKDLSIEEVMLRYFADVEENYPSVVANVARTTGKLLRLEETREGQKQRCGVCNMPLDEQGDERWRGELGDGGGLDGTASSRGRLCYGCERSTRG
ncbi:hypothetical protein B0T17DRAFT_613900 [Bombardia bombarda]|uniref:Cytoplasmic tRNA 2-thiolation protein 2 n=1 Tax=Bombardia bombarda TaxID=252184 RepID=A0AA39XNI0_9PEZI|nr:hypothetical protein B0T17DRAFT_613900 [Bombardia bombarda]